MKRALVVGGSPCAISPEKLREAASFTDYTIAVDKGMDVCIEAGIIPDLFCGDGDSLSENSSLFLNASSIEQVRYNPHKDDTDLGLALSEAHVRGYDGVIVASLQGGRLDHQLAVLGVLKSAQATDIWWVEDDMIARLLRSYATSTSRINFTSECIQKTVSCIALSDPTIVNEKGLRWEADCLELTSLSDRGVSNVVEQSDAYIEVVDGVALICINDAPISLIAPSSK